jgi:hypothetical protein
MPTLTFKVTKEEALEVRRAARLKKRTVSAYLREIAMPRRARPASRRKWTPPDFAGRAIRTRGNEEIDVLDLLGR